jgi:hypothetical protein
MTAEQLDRLKFARRKASRRRKQLFQTLHARFMRLHADAARLVRIAVPSIRLAKLVERGICLIHSRDGEALPHRSRRSERKDSLRIQILRVGISAEDGQYRESGRHSDDA